jgi:hypothetical protein
MLRLWIGAQALVRMSASIAVEPVGWGIRQRQDSREETRSTPMLPAFSGGTFLARPEGLEHALPTFVIEGGG